MSQPDPQINPLAYVAAAAATAAEAALQLAELNSTETQECMTEISVISAALERDPLDALLAVHEAAEELNVARIAQQREEMLTALCGIQAAGYTVSRFLVEQAAGRAGGYATLVNAIQGRASAEPPGPYAER